MKGHTCAREKTMFILYNNKIQMQFRQNKLTFVVSSQYV